MTEIGAASVIHQIAIQIVEAKIAFPSCESPDGSAKISISINTKGPNNKPKYFLFNINKEFLLHKQREGLIDDQHLEELQNSN